MGRAGSKVIHRRLESGFPHAMLRGLAEGAANGPRAEEAGGLLDQPIVPFRRARPSERDA